MNTNNLIQVQVRVQKNYFFEFELGKITEFFRVRVRSPCLIHLVIISSSPYFSIKAHILSLFQKRSHSSKVFWKWVLAFES